MKAVATKTIITMLFLCSCGKTTKALDHITKPEKPFEWVSDSELNTYLISFKNTFKVETNYVATEFATLEAPTVGLCWSYDDGSRKIQIDSNYWKSVNSQGKEQLMWHEAGHCVFNRGHNDETMQIKVKLNGEEDYTYGEVPKSIMNSYVFGEEWYYNTLKNHYIKELKP